MSKKNDAIYNIRRAATRGSHQNVSVETLRALAPVLQTTVGYLVDGVVDTRGDGSNVPVWGRIGAGGAIDTASEHEVPPESRRMVHLAFPVTADAMAWEVTGDSMWPRYDDGDIVVTGRFIRDPSAVIGHVAIVITEEGSRFLKRVRPGTAPGLFHLESHNAPLMVDVPATRFARILAVVPKGLAGWLELSG